MAGSTSAHSPQNTHLPRSTSTAPDAGPVRAGDGLGGADGGGGPRVVPGGEINFQAAPRRAATAGGGSGKGVVTTPVRKLWRNMSNIIQRSVPEYDRLKLLLMTGKVGHDVAHDGLAQRRPVLQRRVLDLAARQPVAGRRRESSGKSPRASPRPSPARPGPRAIRRGGARNSPAGKAAITCRMMPKRFAHLVHARAHPVLHVARSDRPARGTSTRRRRRAGNRAANRRQNRRRAPPGRQLPGCARHPASKHPRPQGGRAWKRNFR